jgi:hypothetical protein
VLSCLGPGDRWSDSYSGVKPQGRSEAGPGVVFQNKFCGVCSLNSPKTARTRLPICEGLATCRRAKARLSVCLSPTTNLSSCQHTRDANTEDHGPHSQFDHHLQCQLDSPVLVAADHLLIPGLHKRMEESFRFWSHPHG